MSKFLLFLCFLAPVACSLSADERTALISLCNSITGWCDATAAAASGDLCTLLDEYIDCVGDTVTAVTLEKTGQSFAGFIPTSIGKLTNLGTFYARSNSINGFIPTELGLTKAYDINLSNNQLIGGIPTELNALSLIAFEASSNQLSGPISAGIFNSRLQSLNLAYNAIEGSIPTQIGNAPNLHFLTLNDNDMTGTIPTQIGQCTSMFQLMLSGNEFTSTLPTQIGNLGPLSILTLMGNQLSGSIPTEIGNLAPRTGSYYLLGQNAWTGTIPTEIGQLTQLMQFAVYKSPSLSGTIPSEIGRMTTAHSLWIHETSVYGSIPTQLNQMSNIISLRIHNNLLSGTVPEVQTTFGSARQVSRQEFWVEQNFLKGAMPSLGNQVLLDCTNTFLTPSDICRFQKACLNNADEIATSFVTSNLCVQNSVLTGNLVFTAAANETCFSEYLLYLGTSAPSSAVPLKRIPKTPRTGNSLSVNLNSVNIAGSTKFFLYSSAGVPATSNAFANGPLNLDLSTIATCSSASPSPSRAGSRTPSRSVAPSSSPAAKDESSKPANNTAAIAIGVVLVGAGALVIALVIFRRRQNRNRLATIRPKGDYDSDAL